MPFDGDAEALLAAIQRQVFDSGDYQIPWIEPEVLDLVGFFDVSPEDQPEFVAQYGMQPLIDVANRVGLENTIAWCNERIEKQDFTLDELRALQCISSSGTHSPLDICGVSTRPENHALFPLATEQVVRVFGKEQLQPEDVSGDQYYIDEKIPGAYERWQAVYVPVYSGDSVTQAYVEGASGD